MKLAINGEHRQFFRKHHAIEFEELLTPAQLEEVNRHINEVLAKRLKIPAWQVFKELPERLFMAGRDLWRDSDYLKKICTNPHFAEVASELIEFRPLRVGYDQFFSTIPQTTLQSRQPDSYRDLLMHPRSLKEISCLQGVLCGLMICLSGRDPEDAGGHPKIFPDVAGSGIFFSPEAFFDFKTLIQNQPHRYLLIVYTHPSTIYFLQNSDPLTHELKHRGYVFGDKLSDKLNPIVFR